MSLASLMTTTGNLERRTVTKGEMGGEEPTWSVQLSTERCDVQPAGADTLLKYARNNIVVTHRIFFTRDISARVTDRFVVGTRYFKVVGYSPPGTGRFQWPAVIDAEEEFA